MELSEALDYLERYGNGIVEIGEDFFGSLDVVAGEIVRQALATRSQDDIGTRRRYAISWNISEGWPELTDGLGRSEISLMVSYPGTIRNERAQDLTPELVDLNLNEPAPPRNDPLFITKLLNRSQRSIKITFPVEGIHKGRILLQDIHNGETTEEIVLSARDSEAKTKIEPGLRQCARIMAAKAKSGLAPVPIKSINPAVTQGK